jgi:uncharacterized protein YxeA
LAEEKMKKTLAFIVLVALLVNCAHTIPHYFDYERKRPIVISKRVGETIEPEEREQFDLFHGIGDFKAATFYGIKGGGYEVEIVTANEQLIVVNRDPQAIEILQDYIERYEEIKDSREAFEEKWEIVDYDDSGLPITKSEASMNVQHGWCIGCSGGCGLVSFGLSCVAVSLIALGELSSQHPGENDDLYMAMLIGGTVAGMLTGFLMGRTVDSRRAIDAIKEARKSRVVE